MLTPIQSALPATWNDQSGGSNPCAYQIAEDPEAAAVNREAQSSNLPAAMWFPMPIYVVTDVSSDGSGILSPNYGKTWKAWSFTPWPTDVSGNPLPLAIPFIITRAVTLVTGWQR
jgi:hypothetical protein